LEWTFGEFRDRASPLNTYNFSQDCKNKREEYGWKQGKQYPSLHERTNKLEDTLDKFIQFSISD